MSTTLSPIACVDASIIDKNFEQSSCLSKWVYFFKKFSNILSLFTGLLRRILMNSLAKAAAHGLGQKDCGIAVFIAQPVRR